MLESLWKHPGSEKNWWNISQVLPPIYQWNSNQDSLFVMKEVHGNVWKTGIIDQSAKEPELYWVKFPDNSILRRTRSMIKPRSQPSYFELEAEGRERNSSGNLPSHSHHPFNSNLQATGDTSFASGQSGPTSFDKQDYPVYNRKPYCQFHQCISTFHQRWSSGNSIHSKMIQPTKQRNSTSEVHSFKEVTVCVLYGTYGSQWKGYYVYIGFCVGLV